jgi:wyosine [tRNA(Phe)-imidazoG37] synthetase (radical SAM superfamily)
MISFGPVPSRRLGKSLGINNIVRSKVCSYSCVYCQVGRTDRLSFTRQFFFDPDVILQEVSRHLEKLPPNNRPDYLTFVSNGEPTLDINLGRSIRLLKRLGFPVAVITNASLLPDNSVREDLNEADWVSVKVDAADQATWRKVNRPANELKFENYINRLFSFASGYKGLLRTETMLCREVNDSEENISGVASIINKIRPGKAYISVPVRPPAFKSIMPPEADRLNLAWQLFTEAGVDTELLTDFEGADTGFTGNSYEDILNITAVHPLREDALKELLDKNGSGIDVVNTLMEQRLIRSSEYLGKLFYIRNLNVQE